MMSIYSAMVIVINRRQLPAAVRMRSYRLGIMVWATLLFGGMAALTIWQQLQNLR